MASEDVTEARRMIRAVVIVDDEDAFRIAVARVLRLKGFSVVEAGDGRAALKLVRDPTAEFDALLLDATLPDVSAADVFAATADLRPQVLVILTSAYAQEDALRLAGAPAGCPFIRKPFRIDELIRLLDATRGPASSGPIETPPNE